jgi:hypothetical protein
MKTILALALTFLMKREAIERELELAFLWYNEYRTHSTLDGRTPNEVYEGRNPGNENPRFEPRSRLIRGSPYTKPEGKRGLAPEEHSDEVPVPLFRRATGSFSRSTSSKGVRIFRSSRSSELLKCTNCVRTISRSGIALCANAPILRLHSANCV